MLQDIWLLFSEVFTVVGLVLLALKMLPLPIFDRNGTTLMCASKEKQVATAKRIALLIGNPIAELNTETVHRFLFKDGTSVDWLVGFPHQDMPYQVVALKSIVYGLFSKGPMKNIPWGRLSKQDWAWFKRANPPDPAFGKEDIMLFLAEEFETTENAGFGLLIRKHAFRISGPRPKPFKGWPATEDRRDH